MGQTPARFAKTIAFAFVVIATSTTALAKPLHVIVDPGHGGDDRGATNDNLKESEIVLKVAHDLEELLAKDDRFKVTMTRTTDQTVSLVERTQLAKNIRADVFLSIHVNSNPSSKAKGPEIYFQNQMPPDEQSRFLASRENITLENTSGEVSNSDNDVNNIVSDMRRSFHTYQSFGLVSALRATWAKTGIKPAIRQGPFHVLYEVPMPSALVELGFISNSTESQWLAQPETHRKLAQILYEGLIQFKERLDKKRHRS